MKLNIKILGLVVSCYALLISQAAFCNVRLPLLVSDGMVLQRDAEVKLWGWADAGEEVTINFKGNTYTAAADSDGKWMVVISQLKAGGPSHNSKKYPDWRCMGMFRPVKHGSAYGKGKRPL